MPSARPLRQPLAAYPYLDPAAPRPPSPPAGLSPIPLQPAATVTGASLPSDRWLSLTPRPFLPCIGVLVIHRRKPPPAPLRVSLYQQLRPTRPVYSRRQPLSTVIVSRSRRSIAFTRSSVCLSFHPTPCWFLPSEFSGCSRRTLYTGRPSLSLFPFPFSSSCFGPIVSRRSDR